MNNIKKPSPLPSSLPIPKITNLNSTKRTYQPIDEVDQKLQNVYKKSSSPFLQRKTTEKKDSVFSNIGPSFIRNFITSPFSQKKVPHGSQKCDLDDRGDDGGGGFHHPRLEFNNQYQQSPIPSRKMLSPNKSMSPTNEEKYGGSTSNRNLHGNTSPIVLQRFYHQQNQLRERERERRLADKQFNLHLTALSSGSCNNYSFYERMPNTDDSNTISSTTVTDSTQSSKFKSSNASKEDQGVVKRQFASYMKLNLVKNEQNENEGEDNSLPPNNFSRLNNEKKYNFLRYDNSDSAYRTTINSSTKTQATTTTTTNTDTQQQQQYGALHPPSRQYPLPLQPLSSAISGTSQSSSAPGSHDQHLKGLDRRHRSPDPPPRLNRGQSPMLLRKNLYELQQNSPKLQRRYLTSSPLPQQRRGSESMPGSPQHFRTRIHYTPEPQRRVYRSIDQ